MKTDGAKAGCVIGIIAIFIVFTIGAIIKQIGMETGTIMGIVVITLTPFIFLLWNKNKKLEGNIHYNVKRQKFYWRVKSVNSHLR